MSRAERAARTCGFLVVSFCSCLVFLLPNPLLIDDCSLLAGFVTLALVWYAVLKSLLEETIP